MAEIIRRVESVFEKSTIGGNYCSCGRYENDGSEEKDCSCGGTSRPVLDKLVPGYVVVKCNCGRTVDWRRFTNTCDCGFDYNFAGSELADRSEWGEETGEHWSQCM